MINIKESDLKKWRKLAYIITNEREDTSSYYAEEILSYVLNNLKNQKIDNLDNYVFISLKNRYLTVLDQENTKRKRDKVFIRDYEVLNNEIDDFDVETLQDKDNRIQGKLEAIIETYDKILDTFEKQLFFIYFVKGLSERDIVEKTSISRYTIRKKIKEIKDKIKNHYDTKEIK